MNTKQTTVFLIALFSLLSTPLSHAGFTLSPMVGHFMADNSLDSDDSEYGALYLGYRLDGPVAFELGFLNTSPEFEGTNADYDINFYTLDLLYHLHHQGDVQPFLLLGAGNVDYVNRGPMEYNSTVVNVGAGFKSRLSSNFDVRAEVRFLNDVEAEFSNYAVGLGLTYYFGQRPGGKKPAKKVVPVAPPTPVDTDNDGVSDDVDNCPGTPIGMTVDDTGCEVITDSDNDGVVDSVDECPDTSVGALVDSKGCYQTIKETKKVALNVVFASGSTEVPTEFYSEVKNVASFMVQYPLTTVVIEGHTDDSGSAAFNKKLSQSRADAVAQLLVTRYNIDMARVSSVGYGESQPLVANSSPQNRAINRRVTAVVSAIVESIKK